MRTLNKGKKILATHVLGLFLAAALPLTASVGFTSPAISAEPASLNDSVMPEQQVPLKTIISECSKSSTLKRIDLTFFKPQSAKVQAEAKQELPYNLGMALHAQRELRENDSFLNQLLNEISQNLESTNPKALESFASLCAQDILDNFTSFIETIARGTYKDTISVKTANERRLEIANGTYQTGIASLAYINSLINLREEGTSKINAEKSKLDEEYLEKEASVVEMKAKENEAYNKSKAKLDNQITAIKQKIQSKSNDQDLKAELSEVEGQLKALEIKHNETIQKLEKELSDKKAEDMYSLASMQQENKIAEDNLAQKLNFVFGSMGSSYFGLKSIYRLISGKPVNRERFDYNELNEMLQKAPKTIVDARAMMMAALMGVEVKSDYSAEVIKEELVRFLKIQDSSQALPVVIEDVVDDKIGSSDEVATSVASAPESEEANLPLNEGVSLAGEVSVEKASSTQKNQTQSLMQQAKQTLQSHAKKTGNNIKNATSSPNGSTSKQDSKKKRGN